MTLREAWHFFWSNGRVIDPRAHVHDFGAGPTMVEDRFDGWLRLVQHQCPCGFSRTQGFWRILVVTEQGATKNVYSGPVGNGADANKYAPLEAKHGAE